MLKIGKQTESGTKDKRKNWKSGKPRNQDLLMDSHCPGRIRSAPGRPKRVKSTIGKKKRPMVPKKRSAPKPLSLTNSLSFTSAQLKPSLRCPLFF